jgi:CheY-like chemotaxis protein
MPVMDGYEATRMIRKLDDQRAKMIPIVAMTANVFREDVEKCIASGMNDHIGKPLDISNVMSKLRKYLL